MSDPLHTEKKLVADILVGLSLLIYLEIDSIDPSKLQMWILDKQESGE